MAVNGPASLVPSFHWYVKLVAAGVQTPGSA